MFYPLLIPFLYEDAISLPTQVGFVPLRGSKQRTTPHPSRVWGNLSNLEPGSPEDLPKIMHWLNWYTAMCFNRMLNRTGHFWEKRYHSSGFETSDYRRALNTLRYIHANPKAAGMQQGFFYDFSNYGTHLNLWFNKMASCFFIFREKFRRMCGKVSGILQKI
jgi:hypothetical protein